MIAAFRPLRASCAIASGYQSIILAGDTFGWIHNNGPFCHKTAVGNCAVLKTHKLKGCESSIRCNCAFCKAFSTFCKAWLAARVRVLGEEI
ncbi:Uncharacterised protein [Chlamydia trachomatis]|nr:Uncharacterised protein [Chlamydia trachomatis]